MRPPAIRTNGPSNGFPYAKGETAGNRCSESTSGLTNLGLGYLLSERQLDFAAGPIPFQAVIDDCIWNRGSNEFGACAKRVRGLNGWPIVLFPLNSNRSITSQPSDGNSAFGHRPGTIFQRVRPQFVEDEAQHRDHLGGQKDPCAASNEAVAGGCERVERHV